MVGGIPLPLSKTGGISGFTVFQCPNPCCSVGSPLKMEAQLTAEDDGITDTASTVYATREYVISEFVQSVGRKYLRTSDNALNAFADSDEIDAEYIDDLSRAVSADIVRGYEDHTLRPRDNVRRIEALVILSRVLPELEATREAIEYTDVPAWAQEDIDRLSAAGIVNGYGNGLLGSYDNITVEQVGLLTNRSDALLARVSPGESFYGYINDKLFRNYDPDGPEINPYYGTVAEGTADWSNFTQRTKDIAAQRSEVIQRLSDGELTYEKGSAAQRLYDFYDTMAYQEADREADTATFLRWQNLLLDAATPEAFLEAANTVLQETSVGVVLNVGCTIDVDTGAVYPIVQPNEVEQAAVIAYSAAAQEAYGDEYLEALTGYATALGRGYTAADAEMASDLQKQLHAGKDYYSLYSEMLTFGSILGLLNDNVTDEEIDTVLEALKAQHPEFYSEEIDTFPRPMPTADAAALIRDPSLNIVSLLEIAGFDNFDYVLLDAPTADALKGVTITAENLNGWKINAAYALSRELSFYPTPEEEAAFDAIADCYANALYSGLVNIEAVHALEGGGSDDGEQTLASSLFTLMEKLPKEPAQVWCDYYYSDETTVEILQIVADIWMAYQARFDNNTWLDEATRENAKKKLDNMMVVLAYPDNYIYPEILSHAEGGTYLTNVCAIGKSTLQEAIRECDDHEYTRTVFLMDLDSVNASYLAQLNNISIYAGIIGGAFYDPDASYARNLGAIGSVIGHEIGHAFDANGSQFDESGVRHDWWTAEISAKYEELKNRFVEYYADYEIVDGIVQDSTVSLTENMADFAGMTVIMDILEGDPEAQREALEAYAATWVHISDADNLTSAARLADSHAANQVRVNAIVASLDAFYELYDISEDDPMYVAPENRLQLW